MNAKLDPGVCVTPVFVPVFVNARPDPVTHQRLCHPGKEYF